MAKNAEGEDFVLQTGSSKAIAKEQYMNLIMNAFQQFITIVASPDSHMSEISKRIETMCVAIIHLIPNPKERVRLMAEREIRTEKLKKEARRTDMDTDSYNSELLEINIRMIGEVMTIFDDVLGIVERQYVMPVANEEKFQENLKILLAREEEKAKNEAIKKIGQEEAVKAEMIAEGV